MNEESPRILLIDDGELEAVAKLLGAMEFDFVRLRGAEVGESLAPPLELLIATARHTRAVRRGSPPGARRGKPVRIIAVEEDSPSMRRMLRRLGFQLLVRLPSRESIWRLLIRRALYRGDERRQEERVAVGSDVVLPNEPEARDAVLMDISNRGCRLHAASPFEVGTGLTLELPAGATCDAEPLVLAGRVVRGASTNEGAGPEGTPRHVAAVLFDESLDAKKQSRLAAVINHWSLGPASNVEEANAQVPAIPARASATIPGLLLDAETDPSVRVDQRVALRSGATGRDGNDSSSGGMTERRSHTRGSFVGAAVSVDSERPRVLLGRDISPGGMRIECGANLHLGERLHLALYGPLHSPPFRVWARVVRDDGPDGLALRFEDIDSRSAEALEKLVACLPDVESLELGEAAGLGCLISEILDADEGLG